MLTNLSAFSISLSIKKYQILFTVNYISNTSINMFDMTSIIRQLYWEKLERYDNEYISWMCSQYGRQAVRLCKTYYIILSLWDLFNMMWCPSTWLNRIVIVLEIREWILPSPIAVTNHVPSAKANIVTKMQRKCKMAATERCLSMVNVCDWSGKQNKEIK